MASIFDSLPNDDSESFHSSWRDLKPLDDSNATSAEYFQPSQVNCRAIADIRLERDVLKRRINRAVNRITAAILKNQRKFRRLENELVLIRRDVELARSINYKLYKMVSEQEMTQLDQIDDDLLSTVLDVEDAVEDYLQKLKVDRDAVKLPFCCDTSVSSDKHIVGRNSRNLSTSMCCLHQESFRNAGQSLSDKKSPSDCGAFSDTNSIGLMDSAVDTMSSLDSDIIYRKDCLHRNIPKIKISSCDSLDPPNFNSCQRSTSHPFLSADVRQYHIGICGQKLLSPTRSQFCSDSSMLKQTSLSSQSYNEHSRMSF